jgi:hypothetical protein
MPKLFTTAKIAGMARINGLSANAIDKTTVLLIYGDDAGEYLTLKIEEGGNSVSIRDKTFREVPALLEYIEQLV